MRILRLSLARTARSSQPCSLVQRRRLIAQLENGDLLLELAGAVIQLLAGSGALLRGRGIGLDDSGNLIDADADLMQGACLVLRIRSNGIDIAGRSARLFHSRIQRPRRILRKRYPLLYRLCRLLDPVSYTHLTLPTN